MSLSYQPLKPVLVRTNITNLTNEREFAVIKGGSQTTYKVYNSSNISQSSITFTCPPPSSKIIVSRKVLFTLPVRLTFVGTAPIGQALFQNLFDAPRAFPIQGSIDTLQATINNYSVSINSADVIHAMMHYNTGHELKSLDYSMTPTYQDQSQSYDDLVGAILNPLGNVGDSLSAEGMIMPRGGFPFVIVQNPVSVGTPVTVIIDCLFSEYLYLSPFYWGHGNHSGFYNLTSQDFNLTFLSQAANRMWSHSDRGGTAVVTSSSFAFAGIPGGPTSFPGILPSLQFEYVTPLETQIIPENMPITYCYYDIIRFPTDQNPTAAGVVNTYSSNNIQINSIPSRIYVYMAERNFDKYATPTSTDTFFSIQNLSIQFKNKNGLLASCSQQQLFGISTAAGLKDGWQSFYGQFARAPGTFNVFPASQIGLSGSVIAIDFPEVIGMDSLETVGVLSQSQLQINVTAKNIANRTITPTLWIIVALAGTFTIQGSNQCTAQIGVLSPTDVLDAHEQRGINYDSVKDHEGGDFLSGLKSFFSGVNNFLKDSKLLSKSLKFLPETALLSPIAKSIGYGDGINVGGRRRKQRAGNLVIGDGVEGGRYLDRSNMMQRVKY